MPSAFISYAHSDQEFVHALVEGLQGQGLDIRYDQVVLQIGDSLIRTISQEIADGDFLIAVVSPDSVESEWCQTELAQARNEGINERRVKVLPIRFRGAAMPPMLHDTYWGDADRDDVETLARRLAAAIRAHVEGREDDAARDAEEAEGTGRPPPHAEMAGDVVVAQLEEVARSVFDVFEDWAGTFAGSRNLLDIENTQRRLRWAFEVLPDHVRSGLPLVLHLSNASDAHFAANEPGDIEADMRDELLSVRRQIAQGLPVTRRWTIDADLGPIDVRRDVVARLWQVARGDETFRIAVYISRTAMNSDDGALPPEVVAAKETNGRSVVATLLSLDQPPPEVMVSTAGIRWPVPD